MQSNEKLIVGALNGGRPAWPSDCDPGEFLAACDFHGIAALLWDLAPQDWPSDVLAGLQFRARASAVWEMRHQSYVRQVCNAFERAGIRPIFLKGTALAYSHYENPAARSRGDTDLLIPIGARNDVDSVLRSLGFEKAPSAANEFSSYQATYTTAAPEGGGHSLDVHWKINNSEVLSRLLFYEELAEDAQPIPKLAPNAQAASPVHALLIACMHRSTHKQNPYHVGGHAYLTDSRLIWLKDIQLLTQAFDSRSWDAFLTSAHRKGLRAVCDDGLRATAALYDCSFPPDVFLKLARAGPAEPPRKYLEGGKARQAWMDFWSFPRWPMRVAWLRGHLFPEAVYMRAKYGGSALPLWQLHLRRITSGVGRLFRPQGQRWK